MNININNKYFIEKIQHFAKISYYCYILEYLIKNNYRYLTLNIINRLSRYDNNDFDKINYLDPYSCIPTDNQIFNLKKKLIILLKIFLQY